MTTKYDIYTYPVNGKGSWILYERNVSQEAIRHLLGTSDMSGMSCVAAKIPNINIHT